MWKYLQSCYAKDKETIKAPFLHHSTLFIIFIMNDQAEKRSSSWNSDRRSRVRGRRRHITCWLGSLLRWIYSRRAMMMKVVINAICQRYTTSSSLCVRRARRFTTATSSRRCGCRQCWGVLHTCSVDGFGTWLEVFSELPEPALLLVRHDCKVCCNRPNYETKKTRKKKKINNCVKFQIFIISLDYFLVFRKF